MGESTTNRPPASASGTLAKTPFLHLLVYALDKKLTGSIELFSGSKGNATILFQEGLPAKVRTSEAIAYLGRVLHDLGHLPEEALTRSLAELAKEKASRPMLHGELLVAQRLLEPAQVAAGLREQLARKLRFVAAMPAETAYAYYDGFDALRGWGGEGQRVDPVPLFWGMLIEYAPWEYVSAALDRVTSCRLRLASGKDLDVLGLKEEELAAARLLGERPMRASDLASAARLNDRTARLLAYLLLVTKYVEVLAPAAATPRPPAAAGAPAVTSSRPPARKATSSVSPAVGTTLVPPPGLAPDLATRWREITERAATIDRADYFMMLDIARDATHDEIDAAFFGLVRRWHPDRLPIELSPVSDACSRVFARMSEAHATLADGEQRARYMRLLADGSGSPEMQATVAKVVEAATSFQKAEVCFRRNDLVQAEAFCRKAMEDDPTQPDYLALHAWLFALKPENQSPEKTLQSIQMLERAIAMNERCERAYQWRGMLFKRLGRIDLAVRDFKRAVELNPRNIDAAREVRLYNMRGGRRSSKPPAPMRSTPSPPKVEEPEKPGLFGRLFKKP